MSAKLSAGAAAPPDPAAIEIHAGWLPGALGRIVGLHGEYYGRRWGLGAAFEAEVARELGEFFARFDPARDGCWLACAGGVVFGSIVIDGGAPDSAPGGSHGAATLPPGSASPPDIPAEAGTARVGRLRWFILDEACHGCGVGQRMMAEAMRFCEQVGFARVFLWTFDGLTAARTLYERAGFVLADSFEDRAWGDRVVHQRFDRVLEPPGR